MKIMPIDGQDCYDVFKALSRCKRLVNLEMDYNIYDPVLELGPLNWLQMMELNSLSLYGFQYSLCIDIINSCTLKLKELRIGTRDHIVDAQPFREIAISATNLEILWIADMVYSRDSSVQCRNIYIEMIRCFAGIRRLRELSIHFMAPLSLNELCTACIPLRLRGLSCGLRSSNGTVLEDKYSKYLPSIHVQETS